MMAPTPRLTRAGAASRSVAAGGQPSKRTGPGLTASSRRLGAAGQWGAPSAPVGECGSREMKVGFKQTRGWKRSRPREARQRWPTFILFWRVSATGERPGGGPGRAARRDAFQRSCFDSTLDVSAMRAPRLFRTAAPVGRLRVVESHPRHCTVTTRKIHPYAHHRSRSADCTPSWKNLTRRRFFFTARALRPVSPPICSTRSAHSRPRSSRRRRPGSRRSSGVEIAGEIEEKARSGDQRRLCRLLTPIETAGAVPESWPGRSRTSGRGESRSTERCGRKPSVPHAGLRRRPVPRDRGHDQEGWPPPGSHVFRCLRSVEETPSGGAQPLRQSIARRARGHAPMWPTDPSPANKSGPRLRIELHSQAERESAGVNSRRGRRHCGCFDQQSGARTSNDARP